MKTVVAKLRSCAKYSQSRWYARDDPRKEKESPRDYEERSWRSRLHVDDDGMVFIPAMAFKNCLAEAAQYLGLKIPGRGNRTWTKHFEAGIFCLDNVPLGIPAKEVDDEWLFVPADGKRSGSRRVEKRFPVIHEWSATVTFYIADDTITKEAFEYHLEQAGQFIGIGRFRPRNNGFYGRFSIVELKWDG